MLNALKKMIYIYIGGEKEYDGTISLHTKDANHVLCLSQCLFLAVAPLQFITTGFLNFFCRCIVAKLAHLHDFISQCLQITVTCLAYNASCTCHLMIPARNVSLHYRHSLTYTISSYALPNLMQYEKVKI